MYLLWNFPSRDNLGLEVITMLHCYGFETSLSPYGAWGDTLLDIVQRKKMKMTKFIFPWIYHLVTPSA